MTWAAHRQVTIQEVVELQGNLKVKLIMTPRDQFLTCRTSDTAAVVKQCNVHKFSMLPVIGKRDSVIGLYDAERWFEAEAPDTPIDNDFRPLSEDMLIGADASIFDFFRKADQHPTNLVVSKNRIAGIVSLSDIQALPVRAALFSLVTGFEMAMAHLIETTRAGYADWSGYLSEPRMKMLEDAVDKAKRADTFTTELVLTQFCDKAVIVQKAKLLNASATYLKSRFSRIERLRNDIAHANHYGNTIGNAKAVCALLGDLFELKQQMLDAAERRVKQS